MDILKISEIKSNPNNPRVIKDEKFKKLVQSIKDFPQMLELRPLILDENNVVLGGNMRLKACSTLGLQEIPVIYAKDLTEEQKQEFIIKDNVGFGEWDWDKLANEWESEKLNEWGLDVPEITLQDTEEDDFDVPLIDQVHTDIVLGDLLEIGPHRLLCGDSTESTTVEKVLAGKEPYLMVTDPPYGVVYDPNWRNEASRSSEGMGSRKIGAGATGKVMNDDNADWTATWALSPSKVAYVYHAGKFSGIVQKSLEDCDFEIRSQIIWVKSHFAISRGDYHWRHEPCWYAVKKGSKGNWAGDRKQDTIWEIEKPSKSETGHGTQKPTECMGRAIANHDGDVFDPFLGSGTTMVAGHQLRRVVYGIELDPRYCQVIVDRMKKLDPTLVIKRNGQLWEI